MKHLLSISLAFALFGCSTTGLTPQQQATASALSSVAINAASAYFHLPPSDATVLNVAQSAPWGGMSQAQAGQSVSQGTDAKAVGAAIAAQTPAGTPDQTAALLQAAAQLTAKK